MIFRVNLVCLPFLSFYLDPYIKNFTRHSFFRARRSMNQKLIQGDTQIAAMPHCVAVFYCRHKNDHVVTCIQQNLGIDAKSSNVPDILASPVNCDFMAQTKSSLVASKAHRSVCKAYSLEKLGSRPSYAKETCVLILFLHRIQGDFVDRFNQLADHLDILWRWLICRHIGHVSCYCPLVMLLMINF